MLDPRYELVDDKTAEEIARDLTSADPEKISSALYSSTRYSPDWHSVQEESLKFLQHPDLQVRWTAATCLGDLAMFHRNLDLAKVLGALLVSSQESAIRDAAETSISIIKASVKTQ